MDLLICYISSHQSMDISSTFIFCLLLWLLSFFRDSIFKLLCLISLCFFTSAIFADFLCFFLFHLHFFYTRVSFSNTLRVIHVTLLTTMTRWKKFLLSSLEWKLGSRVKTTTNRNRRKELKENESQEYFWLI